MHATATRRPVKRAPEADSDLPLLAFVLEPPQHVDWDALMQDGVVPSLVLGVERRSKGPR